MRKIWIYSNLDEQCGNYQYGYDLMWALNEHYVGVCIGHEEPADFDTVIVNWHPARVTITTDMVRRWQSQGKKVILVWANSMEVVEAAEDDILRVVDAVVAHEPVISNTVKVHYIYHGILEPEIRRPWTTGRSIGTAGFLFPWKRPDVVFKAAIRTNSLARVVAPNYNGIIDPDGFLRMYGQQCQIELLRGFLAAADVIRTLAANTLNIFWFQSHDVHDQFGQTGSARLGLAAKRPMIISRHRKFRTILPYSDELYVAETEEDVYRCVEEILAAPEKAKVPNQILKDMGWSRVGKMYQELIESLWLTP